MNYLTNNIEKVNPDKRIFSILLKMKSNNSS